MKRLGPALLLLASTAPLAAQVAEGNAHWTAGRFGQAKAAYERELMREPSSVRALYRLAVLASWDNRLDSALSLVRRARAADPRDPDIRILEARLHAWRGDLAGAIAHYDSVLSEDPGNSDARAGLAEAHFWQGRTGLASRELELAARADSSNEEVRRVRAAVRHARQPRAETVFGWSNDSDHNTSWSQTLTVSAPVTDAARLFATGGAQQSSDPLRDASRVLGEAGVRIARGRVSVTAAGGARRLEPDGAVARTEATYRAGVGLRFAPRVSLAASFAHHPFDETAGLIGGGIDIDALEGSIEAGAAPGLVFNSGGGGAWFSDGNNRYSAFGAVTQSVARRFQVGAFVRQMGYRFRGTGYFSPDRFRLAEARTGWIYSGKAWTTRVSGGLGVQQPFRGAEAAAEWHAEARVRHDWPKGSAVELFGAITNSLESSATGAFRYRTAALKFELGL